MTDLAPSPTLDTPLTFDDTPAAPQRGLIRRPWIQDWNPDDEEFWESGGRKVARRNLIWSILVENVGFSVWQLWSVVTVTLVAAGYGFSVDQLFLLVALPSLVGATLRFPYTVAVPRFGGRAWTVISALLLLLPIAMMILCVSSPDTPYWMFVLAAATAGVGGGNFASSMVNISFFYPDKKKGLALGLNAAGGNVGVATTQLLVPIVVTIPLFGLASQGDGLHLQNAALIWIPVVLIGALGAYLFMDSLAGAKSPLGDQMVVARRSQTWVMSMLYVGTFGSFIGYSAGLPLLIKTQFPDVNGAQFAFLGALVGSAARPFGGWIADRFGGARVTAVAFASMVIGATCVLLALRAGSFAFFLGSFLALFVVTGIGNGSTFRMVPPIYKTQALARSGDNSPEGVAHATRIGRREAAASLGFISAIGAYGGFLIPKSFGTSIAATGGVQAALLVFIAFYGVCLATTWWCYLRKTTRAGRPVLLAHAGV